MSALDAIADWPVPNAAAAVVGTSGVLAEFGDTGRTLRAGVGDQAPGRPRGPGGRRGGRRRTRHHRPGRRGRPCATCSPTRRVCRCVRPTSSPSRGSAASTPTRVSACWPARSSWRRRSSSTRYLTEAVFEPLGMGSSALAGGAEAAGFGGESTVADLARFAGDLLRPGLVSQQMHADAVAVQFPGLSGVLPGYGTQRPNDWGLGFEIRDGKSPHWTGSPNSAADVRTLRPVGHVHLGRSCR